jgi:hypothetical protein
MRINLYMLILVLAVGVGFAMGATLQMSTLQSTKAQEVNGADRVLIHGNGVADSSKRPPIPWERFTLFASNAPRNSFKVVPPGKTFIVTDIMYNTRLVRQNLTVNFARVTPDDKTQTLFQVYLNPGGQEETHLCTGYAIPSGHALGAWTNAGLEPDQWVHIAVAGYLIDERKA